MELECHNSAAAAGSELAGACRGWELVQRDWSDRQDKAATVVSVAWLAAVYAGARRWICGMLRRSAAVSAARR